MNDFISSPMQVAKVLHNPVLRSTAAFVLLPILFFGVLGHYMYMMRPVVNIDYILVGALAPFVPPFVTGSLLALVFSNDLLINLAPIYHFQILDLLEWFKDVYYLNWTYTLPVALLLGGTCAGVSLAALKVSAPRAKARWTPIVLLAMGFLICVADIANGTSFLPSPIRISFLNVNIAYSGVRRTVLSMRELSKRGMNAAFEPLHPGDAAAWPLLEEARTSGPLMAKRQIVLTVVESMGAFRDPEAQKALLAPLLSPEVQARYDVEVKRIPFRGNTIDGEFRELCGVRLLDYGERALPKCLPNYLRAAGFETVGMHGFTNQFYNRFRWYPKLGFDRVLFAEDMKQLGITKTCGSGFKGICDANIAQLIHKELLSTDPQKPKFLYWMTLNSHLPLENRRVRSSKFDCARSAATRADPTICLHTRMINLVLTKLAEIASDPAIPPTEYIIVGDHKPPFVTPARRDLYSDTEVTAIFLKPKPPAIHARVDVPGVRTL